MTITVPEDWIKVSEEGLEQFLKVCADYRSECYVGTRRYRFAHNGRVFAVIKGEECFVRPDLIVK